MLESFKIRVSSVSKTMFSATATNSKRTIKNIFAQTEEEAMTLARLAVLKFFITTETEPLLLYQEDAKWILAMNLAAKKILNTKKDSCDFTSLFCNNCLPVNCPCANFYIVPIKRHLIPQPITLLRIESHPKDYPGRLCTFPQDRA